jgi:hypothetical protein
MALQRGPANAGPWAGTTALLGRSMDRCGLQQWAGKAMGAHRGGSRLVARGRRPGWWQEGGSATCFQNFLEFNGVCAFSSRRRFRRQRSTCGDFVNLKDNLPAQSLGGAHKGRVACVYS